MTETIASGSASKPRACTQPQRRAWRPPKRWAWWTRAPSHAIRSPSTSTNPMARASGTAAMGKVAPPETRSIVSGKYANGPQSGSQRSSQRIRRPSTSPTSPWQPSGPSPAPARSTPPSARGAQADPGMLCLQANQRGRSRSKAQAQSAAPAAPERGWLSV
jgi:hypothetical protein